MKIKLIKKKRKSYILLAISILIIASISNVASMHSINKLDEKAIKSSDDHAHNIGTMKIDGYNLDDPCAVIINDDYESELHPFVISEYSQEDSMEITANWRIVNEVRGIPITTEKWEFILSVRDPYQGDISESEEVVIEDTLGDESGRNGEISLQFEIPRYGFHHNFIEQGKKNLEIRLYCVYYIESDGRFVKEGSENRYGHIDVYPDNQIPEITEASMSTNEIAFGNPVTFTVTASEDDGDPIHFFFDWDGDGFNDYNQDDVVTLFSDETSISKTHTWKKENYPGQSVLEITPTVYVQDKIGGTSQGTVFGELVVPRPREYKSAFENLRFMLFRFLDFKANLAQICKI